MFLKTSLVLSLVIWINIAFVNPLEVRNIAGVLYHPNDEVLYKSFLAGVRRLNKYQPLPYDQSLKTISFKTIGNEILGCKAARELRSSSCIFDLSFGDERSYALAELLQIPMVVLKPKVRGGWASDYFFTLMPPQDETAAATVHLLHYYIKTKHQKVAILAERKQALLGSKVFSLARQGGYVIPYMMPELVIENYRESQRALTVLLRSKVMYVVLVCDPAETTIIMEWAMRVGCIDKDSKWITPNMDIPGNISALALRGLLGLRLQMHGARKLRREAERNAMAAPNVTGLTYAVLNDSLYVVVKAIGEMMKNTFLVEDKNQGKGCQFNPAVTTDTGETILDFLKTINMQGLTGTIQFKTDGSNERVVDEFDIINIQVQSQTLFSHKYKIGQLTITTNSNLVSLQRDNLVNWNGQYWEETECERKEEFMRKHRENDRVIIVTTKEDAPFMIMKDNASLLKGNDRFMGFSKDLLDLLAEKLNVKYEIRISKEKSYGSVKNGEWRGILGELVRQEADIAIGPITITAEREQVIDFSKPFLDFRIAMILQKPLEEDVDLFAFLMPFQKDLWACCCLVVGAVTILMWILDRFSPYGFRAEAKNTGEGEGDEFSLPNSLWFATGSILQQGGDNTPRSGSGRVLAASFWLFTLILISTYTANLAAFFTAQNSKSIINSLEDLVAQDVFKYGVQQGGSLFSFFEKSKVRIYKKMFGKMSTLNTFVKGTDEGVNRSRTTPFAYLTDQPSLDYYNQRKPCNTMLVKNLLDAKSYALGLQRNSEWTDGISVAILQLREEGEVERIRYKWWDAMSECNLKDAVVSNQPMSLELHHLAGVFIILGGGAGISLVILLMENRFRGAFSFWRPESLDFFPSLRRRAPAIAMAACPEQPTQAAVQNAN
ncbi:glutamate receptor 3 isoform X2 [Nematostella vectensis]|uniref:glutamate receptor 3 isoform X2 n=1 Tax=Nematostella vectensis TaxID=45351 RepID=UPI002076DB20|nr:glutamate receptor 3 isoform X2 [Nematostella vectensis]